MAISAVGVIAMVAMMPSLEVAINPELSDVVSGEVSQELNSLLEDDTPTDIVVETLVNITGHFEDFEVVDIHLIGLILEKIATNYEVDAAKATIIVSNVMDVDREILTSSQILLNATDTILRNYDHILINADVLKKDSCAMVFSKNLILLAIDLDRTNISGMVLFNKSGERVVNVLDHSANIDDVVKQHDMEAVFWLGDKLREQISKENWSKRLIVTIFSNNALFDEMKSKTATSDNLIRAFGFLGADIDDEDAETRESREGIIFGALLPDTNEEFEAGIAVYVKLNYTNHYDKISCPYWRFNIVGKSHRLPSGDLDFTEFENRIRCNLWDSTHFGLLVMRNAPLKIANLIALNVITMINCGLSAFGLLGILFTGVVFKSWRANPGNKILINFSIAIAFQIALLYVSYFYQLNYSNHSRVCVALGILLHYFFLAEFCWTLVLAPLQFKRLVTVFGGPPSSLILKSCLVGWGLPLLPILPLAIAFPENYAKHASICYPSGIGLMVTVIAPIVLILCVNFVVFLNIVREICKRNPPSRKRSNHELVYQWRMIIFQFFTLGLTWILGLLTYFDDGAFFIYPFCFLATLQGFILFLFFIPFNKTTRIMYASYFCRNYGMYC